MVTSGADQAVRQQGTSQMSSSEGAKFVANANGHVLIIDMFPQLKTAHAMNATQMPHN